MSAEVQSAQVQRHGEVKGPWVTTEVAVIVGPGVLGGGWGVGWDLFFTGSELGAAGGSEQEKDIWRGQPYLFLLQSGFLSC